MLRYIIQINNIKTRFSLCLPFVFKRLYLLYLVVIYDPKYCILNDDMEVTRTLIYM